MKSRNIQCGILVSYSSKVAKFNTTDISIYNDGLCCIIVIGFAEKVPQSILQAIYFLEVINAKILNTSSEKDSRFVEILNSYSGVYDLLKSFECHKKTVLDSINLLERQMNERYEEFTRVKNLAMCEKNLHKYSINAEAYINNHVV